MLRPRRKALAPYALLAPGGAWLLVFFVVPMYYLAKMSLEQGLFPLFSFEWAWSNFSDAVSSYHAQFVRSLEYAGLATAIALLIRLMISRSDRICRRMEPKNERS